MKALPIGGGGGERARMAAVPSPNILL